MKKYKAPLFLLLFVAILGGLFWLAARRDAPQVEEIRKVIPNEKFFQ